MFFAKFKIFFALALFMVLTGFTATYAEAQMSDKFTQMDKDKNSLVSMPEFKAQYPQMQKRAFDSIDTDKDENISVDEWKTFQDSHSMDQANSPKEMKKMKTDKKNEGKPTIFMNAPSN